MAYENCWVLIDFGGVMVDVTANVDTIGTPIRATDGENAETSDRAGSLTLVLSNIDGRYTPGNVTSPYYPYVRSGRRVEVYEVIGTERFDIFTGRLEWPEVDSWVQASTSAPREQTITLTAVDLPTQLDNAATFLGNLGEYIRYHGGETLKAYWPMNDITLPFLPVTDAFLPTTSKLYSLTWGESTTQTGTAQIIPASAAGPPGDDGHYAHYEMDLRTVSGFLRPARTMLTQVNMQTGTLPIGTGERATVVFWVRSPWSAVDSESIPMTIAWEVGGGGTGFLELKRQDGIDGTWLLEEVGSSGMTASCEGPKAASDRWTLIGIRWGDTPLVFELWVDGQQIVDTPSGSVSGTTSEISTLWMPEGRFDGSIAHVQVYIGAEADYTFADFTAQRRAGLDGLERQLTGDRIRTVLRYAGITDGEMGDIDDGTGVMQQASLAGRTPGDVIREAVDTERGDFHANGSGRPVFYDRHTLYNI